MVADSPSSETMRALVCGKRDLVFSVVRMTGASESAIISAMRCAG